MSPEMKNDDPNGIATDMWSLGVLVGVILGLEDITPEKYKGGTPGFIKNCAAGKHDLLLHTHRIYISDIMKDFLKGLMMVNQKNRSTIQQVIDHKFIVMDLTNQTKGY